MRVAEKVLRAASAVMDAGQLSSAATPPPHAKAMLATLCKQDKLWCMLGAAADVLQAVDAASGAALLRLLPVKLYICLLDYFGFGDMASALAHAWTSFKLSIPPLIGAIALLQAASPGAQRRGLPYLHSILG